MWLVTNDPIGRPPGMNYWDRTDTWTTRDGDVIPLEKLTASHRANIIAMLYRQASHIREHMSNQIMVLSLSLTGEMAMDMAALEQQRVDGVGEADPCGADRGADTWALNGANFLTDLSPHCCADPGAGLQAVLFICSLK